MELSQDLRNLIDALIDADMAGDGYKINTVRKLLNAATDETIAQVSAIYLFGRDDDEIFDEVLQQERQHVIDSGRERVITYLSGKDFARVMPKGLMRVGRA